VKAEHSYGQQTKARQGFRRRRFVPMDAYPLYDPLTHFANIDAAHCHSPAGGQVYFNIPCKYCKA